MTWPIPPHPPPPPPPPPPKKKKKRESDLSLIYLMSRTHSGEVTGRGMNAIFEESSATEEEPVENKEEYLANLLKTRRWYDLLASFLLQSYNLLPIDVNSHRA